MRGPSTGLQSPWLLFCPLALSVSLSLGCHARNAEFIRVTADSVALTHVRVIDGTGTPAKDDQTIIIQSGRIRSLAPVNLPAALNSAMYNANNQPTQWARRR